MAAILDFRIFAKKMEKHKFACISLTVRDTAILSKFSTHRVSQQTTLCIFQKNFLSPKMAAILNYRIFAKNAKTQICFYLLTWQDRAIFSKFSTHRVSKQSTLGNFQKNFPLPKNDGHFRQYSNFSRKWKNKNWLLSP